MFDVLHENLLDINEPDYASFRKLLKKLGFDASVLDRDPIREASLDGEDVLVIGCPVNELIRKGEVDTIVDFVRKGGQLLVASEYGGDTVQKTNLNELTKHFGIYFESSIIKSSRFGGSPNAPLITKFADHAITKNVLKLLLGGCASIRLAKNAEGLVFSGADSWVEIYNQADFEWNKRAEIDLPIATVASYGNGRVFAIGDVDIFSNDEIYGLKSMDNERFITNTLRWLTRPVNQDDVMGWVLSQIGLLSETVATLAKNVQNIIETTQHLDERISELEGPGREARDSTEVVQTQKRRVLEQDEDQPV